MPIRTAIAASVAKRQAGVDPAAGACYHRGGRLAFVWDVADGLVTWRNDDGTEESGSVEEFRARALEPVDVSTSAASFLDGAWQLASGRNIERSVRQLALARVLPRAPSQVEREQVAEWMRALARGLEPERKER